MRAIRRGYGITLAVIAAEMVLIAVAIVWYWGEIVDHLARSPIVAVVVVAITPRVIWEVGRALAEAMRGWRIMRRGH